MHERKRILITGASGLVGSRLTKILQQRGHEVWHLSRGKDHRVKTFQWDIENQKIEQGAFDGVQTIIHLAGANVGDKKWTTARKQLIIDSRVNSTRLILNELSGLAHEVNSFISASAVGYYGFKNTGHVFNETDPPGNDFLAQVTRQWENEVDKMKSLRLRVVKMRIGVVLAKEGGALGPISKSVKWFVGAPLGSGKQMISWIHIDDLCQMFVHAVENDHINGAYNAVASTPVSNRELTKQIAHKLNKPMILPAVPSFALRLALGEMADIVLEGNKVSASKILQTGFTFKFHSLDSALSDLL
jgi:uncharacterized protein (TIGR01777 family)